MNIGFLFFQVINAHQLDLSFLILNLPSLGFDLSLFGLDLPLFGLDGGAQVLIFSF